MHGHRNVKPVLKFCFGASVELLRPSSGWLNLLQVLTEEDEKDSNLHGATEEIHDEFGLSVIGWDPRPHVPNDCQCCESELVCSVAFPVACERRSGGNVESPWRHVRPICTPELAWRLHSASCLSKSDVFVFQADETCRRFSINTVRQIAGLYRWIVSNYSVAIRRVHLVVYRAISPEVKPPFNADVKNEWMQNSTLP